MNDAAFNQYLKKYENLYQTSRTEDAIISIKCRYGLIQPNNPEKKLLLFAGTFPTKKKKSFALKRIPSFCGLLQDCEQEFTVSFPEAKLAELADLFSIYKRKRLSDEARAKLRDNGRKLQALRSSKLSASTNGGLYERDSEIRARTE